MTYQWQGKRGLCVVGETYAQGDRADLAEEILRLLMENNNLKLSLRVAINNGSVLAHLTAEEAFRRATNS